MQQDLSRRTLEVLAEQANDCHCDVFTYCLMPDHLHFLASPQVDGVSVLSFVDRFKSISTRTSWELGWHGKLWQARYYDHIVRSTESLREIASYILNNPVRTGLAETTDEWPWSGHMQRLPL